MHTVLYEVQELEELGFKGQPDFVLSRAPKQLTEFLEDQSYWPKHRNFVQIEPGEVEQFPGNRKEIPVTEW